MCLLDTRVYYVPALSIEVAAIRRMVVFLGNLSELNLMVQLAL